VPLPFNRIRLYSSLLEVAAEAASSTTAARDAMATHQAMIFIRRQTPNGQKWRVGVIQKRGKMSSCARGGPPTETMRAKKRRIAPNNTSQFAVSTAGSLHTISTASMPPSTNQGAEELPVVGRKPPRKRAHPELVGNQEDGAPRKKAREVSNEALLTLCLEGVRAELKESQDKYEAACREHEAIVEEKNQAIAERDYKIAELEQRLYYAEQDSFYACPAPHFYYSEEKFGREETPEYQIPRLCSRRGR